MTPSPLRRQRPAHNNRHRAWLSALLAMGCGGSTVQQPAPELETAVEQAAEDPVAAEPVTEPTPPPETLPPEVASLRDDVSLAQHTRRAWVERAAAIRFARGGAVRPAEPRDPWTAQRPNVVVDVAEADVRLVHQGDGLRVLLWTHADDLTRVPVQVVAVRPSRTAAAPADDAPGVRLHPGFRLPNAVAHGDLTEFAYSRMQVAFGGLVPNASLGAVFVPTAPTERAGDWSRLHSSAALRDRPNGRVIAQFSPLQPDSEYFEHHVALLGEERSGHRLVAFQGAASDDEHFEVIGWARTRDLMIEPVGAVGHGFGTGGRGESPRSLRVALSAGTAIYDTAGGTIIGLAFQDIVVAADADPAGGFEFDLSSPWGVLALHAARGTVMPAGTRVGTSPR